jgi:hypothetical protein
VGVLKICRGIFTPDFLFKTVHACTSIDLQTNPWLANSAASTSCNIKSSSSNCRHHNPFKSLKTHLMKCHPKITLMLPCQFISVQIKHTSV